MVKLYSKKELFKDSPKVIKAGDDHFKSISNQEDGNMFGEKGEAVKFGDRAKEVSTILDRDSSFEGKMTFEGCVVINGRFKGEIFSEGSLIVGEGGYVEGKVDIGAIQIQGEVRGNISAKEKIEINAPAVVQGDIAAPSLVIKEGAVFEGNCSMGRKEQENVVDFAPRQAE